MPTDVTVVTGHLGGNVVERYDYDVYGARLVTDLTAAQPPPCSADFGDPCSSSHGNPLGYTGRPLSNITGLYDLRYRQYDPLLRVFLSPDPLGYAASGFDLWLYVGGDPLNFIDPMGLAKVGVGPEEPRLPAHLLGDINEKVAKGIAKKFKDGKNAGNSELQKLGATSVEGRTVDDLVEEVYSQLSGDGVHISDESQIAALCVVAKALGEPLPADCTQSTTAAGPKLYENQLPSFLDDELGEADALGVAASTGDEALRSLAGKKIKWVVTKDGSLVFVPHTHMTVEISHTVASGGEPVQAAGEAFVKLLDDGTLQGEFITSWSGHYFKGKKAAGNSALPIGVEAFKDWGVTFNEITKVDE